MKVRPATADTLDRIDAYGALLEKAGRYALDYIRHIDERPPYPDGDSLENLKRLGGLCPWRGRTLNEFSNCFTGSAPPGRPPRSEAAVSGL